MLKREELAILDRAIVALTPQSYLGPWLQAVRAEVEASIVSDLEPAMLPAEAYARAQQTIADARLEAEQVRANARAEADAVIKSTRARVDDYRTRARRELEKIAGGI